MSIEEEMAVSAILVYCFVAMELMKCFLKQNNIKARLFVKSRLPQPLM